MNSIPHTKNEDAILHRFREGHNFAEIILPFGEIALDSNHLVLGYAGGGFQSRDDMIPYFHILSHSDDLPTISVFALNLSPDIGNKLALTLLRTVLAMDARAALIRGIELTVFPKLPRLRTTFDLATIRNKPTHADPADFNNIVLEKEYLRLHPQVLLGIETDVSIDNTGLKIASNNPQLANVLRTALHGTSEASVTLDPELAESSPLRVILRVPEIDKAEQQSKELRNQILVVLHTLRDYLRSQPSS